MSLVTERCKTCEYVGEILFGDSCCEYILKTGERRGCPAGDKCTRYLHKTNEEDEK